MKKEKKPGAEIAKKIIEEYQPETVTDMENALKEIFGPMFEAMLQGEMTEHLGYKSNDHGAKNTVNRRNGYSKKTLKTSSGTVDINVPRDRESTFEPKLIPKHQNNVSELEKKVIAMYARGMSQRDISATIEDIYGFEMSAQAISNITDSVMDELNEWQNRPLKKFYTFLFVDCMYVSVRKDYEVKNCAVYSILGYDIDGRKDILGLWINETESKHTWMQIFDEIKCRGVEDILFISMDGVSGLEEGAKAVFPDVVVQRCVVHMIRNSIKYIPSKYYKAFTASLKKVYAAPCLKACEAAFEEFQKEWSEYPGAVNVWINNFSHIQQLFSYGSAVRKIMYTTNAIESINADFRKVTRKGTFPNETALYKALYLRVTELYRKWNDRPVPNWSLVRNQLLTDKSISERFRKYENCH